MPVLRSPDVRLIFELDTVVVFDPRRLTKIPLPVMRK